MGKEESQNTRAVVLLGRIGKGLLSIRTATE